MHPATVMGEDYCTIHKRSTHVAAARTGWLLGVARGRASHRMVCRDIFFLRTRVFASLLGHFVPVLVVLGPELLAGEHFGPRHALEHVCSAAAGTTPADTSEDGAVKRQVLGLYEGAEKDSISCLFSDPVRLFWYQICRSISVGFDEKE